MNQQQVIEIDLIDLLKKILKSWYLVLICMLIFGIAFPAVRWKMNVRSYKAAQVEKQGIRENTDGMQDNLTEDDRVQIEQCQTLYRKILQTENYLSESALMQVDPYNAPEVTLQYVLTSQDNILQIKEAYSAYIVNHGFTEDVVKAVDWKDNPSYLSELVSLGNSYTNTQDEDTNVSLIMPDTSEDSDKRGTSEEKTPKMETLVVRVIGRSEEEAGSIAGGVQASLDDYAAEVSSFYSDHSLILAKTYQSFELDSDLLYKINNTNDQLTNYQNTLKNLETSLTDDQKKVWESIRESVGESVKEEAASASSLSESQDGTDDQNAADSQEQAPTVSKKDIAIGLLLGLVIAFFCLALRYVLCGKLHTVDEVRTIYQKPILGTFSRKNAFWQAEKKTLAGNIRLACRKDDINKLVLATSTAWTDSEKQILNSLSENLGTEIAISFQENALDNPEAFYDLGESGAVIFCEKLETSKREQAFAEARMCRELGVKCAGVVLFC